MELPTRVYTPGEAAQELGVTTNTLRRYAEDYAGVFEAVFQRGRQRVFDDVILERLRAAQSIQQLNRAPSMLAALEMVRDGFAQLEGIATPRPPVFEEAVLERLTALAEMVTQLHAENRILHNRLNTLEAPRDVAKLDKLEAENADLHQRNSALLGELERRRTEAEKPTRRLWWRVWGRR